ncbi:MAG TPA: ABC transporter substrate-binding protein [Candidatus Binataceae bacterium]|nr:ABC transporter substrate-binding protein [Candidatus Binataceae bacterium]
MNPGRWLALAALTLLLAACQHDPALNFPPGAQVLHLASQDDVPTLDPAAGYDTASWSFEQALFDTLVRYADGSIALKPDLATSWESSPDATHFTFHLRHDARFSNGRVVTSGDLKYSLQRVLTPATRSKGIEYYRNILGAEDYIAGRANDVRGIATPDPYTISFTLRAPDPIFIHKLCMPFAAAVPREAVQRWGDDFSSHPVGSGAFELKQWRRGQYLVLTRNPYYFVRGQPRLDAVVERVGVNEELEWLQYRAGEVDVAGIPSADFPAVIKDPRLAPLILKIVSAATDYLGLNCQMAPLTDVRVRRAFNYAIDKRKLLALLNGRGVIAHDVLPPGLPGYDPDLAGYPYDPARARHLLAAAGVKAGFAPELWMRADQTMLLLGESIQQDLALVGINVRLKPVAWGPLLEAVRQPSTVALSLLGWEADFPDPENFLNVLFSKAQWGSNNDTFYYNPEVDRLMAQAAPLADLHQRLALYKQAEKLIVADAPWVFLYHPVTYVIRQPWVHGWVLNPMRPTRFEKVWISAH